MENIKRRYALLHTTLTNAFIERKMFYAASPLSERGTCDRSQNSREPTSDGLQSSLCTEQLTAAAAAKAQQNYIFFVPVNTNKNNDDDDDAVAEEHVEDNNNIIHGST